MLGQDYLRQVYMLDSCRRTVNETSSKTTDIVSEKVFTHLLCEIQGLRKAVNDIRVGVDTAKIKIVPNYIYNNKDLKLILGVDERLIKKYRDEGFLTYHRQSDKYWYTGTDILDFLNRTRYEAFAN